MKKIVLAALLVLLSFGTAMAQCDKKFVLTSSKTDYLDSSNNLQRSLDEESVVEISNSEIKVIPGNPERVMAGPVKSHECNWKVPYKEGKSIVKATVSNHDGETRDVLITIEGKDGAITFIAVLDNDQNRKVRLNVNSFQEKK